jgi:hypothetical protein
LQRKVALMLTNFMALPAVLTASDLVAAAPLRFARLPSVQALCGYRDLPVKVPGYQMKAVWPLTHDSDPALVWLRSLLPATTARSALK